MSKCLSWPGLAHDPQKSKTVESARRWFYLLLPSCPLFTNSLKLVLISPRRFALLFFTLLCVSPAFAAAPLTTIFNSRSGQPTVLGESGILLEFGGYDWGPGWGPAKRQTQVIPASKQVESKTTVELPATRVTYEVETVWSHPQAKTLRAEAALRAPSATELTLSVLTLAPKSFESGKLIASMADGASQEFPLPLGQVPIGEKVKTLRLENSAGQAVTVTFDQPTPVAADRALRIILARDRLAAGDESKVGFSVQLPEATDFITSADDLPDTQAGWYAFKGASPIPAESEWRLSDWLESPAGKHGRIVAREDVLFYNNQPIKLWGINVSFRAAAPDKSLADRRADFYAALGINSVRLHKYADGDGWAGILKPGTAVSFDPQALDRMDYFVNALKQRGIYSKLSSVFIIKPGEQDAARIPYLHEFEKSGQGDKARYKPRHGAIYVSRELQDLLAEQMTNLLSHRNPYTGLTYAEDPAIAFVELYNEDSALFGGVSHVMRQSPTLRARTGERFARWLKEKYGSEEAFRKAWGEQALNNSILQNQNLPLDESLAENRIYPAGNPWFFDPVNLNTSQAPYKQRLLDTMLFLKELQDETYARLEKAVRATGYSGEIIASNWHAGRQMSHYYNLHSDALIGTVDRHNYFGDGARGESGPMNAASMVSTPGGGSLSSSLNQVGNRPFMLSEWIHVFSNEWGVEGPAILGAYGLGLQGWDVSYPFQNSDDGSWSLTIGAEPWDATAPQFLGIFPAVSRQVHRGDVTESPVVHTRHVHLPSLAEQKVGFAEFNTQEQDVKTFDSDVFPAAALAVGRGVVEFTKEFQPTAPLDLSAHRDASGALLSVTEQLRWQPGKNPRDGFFQINSPGTQAVVGFAEGQEIRLTDATIRPQSRFGAIYLTAQSKEGTLAKDRGVLVAAIARARNRDQRVFNDVYLARSGTQPNVKPPGVVFMEPVKAEITLNRPGTPTVHILDHNGVRTGKTLPVQGGKLQIDTGRDETPFYLITWES